MQIMLLHKSARARVVLTRSTLETVKVMGQDEATRIPKWGKTIEFSPLGEPWAHAGKLWRGKANIEDPDLYAKVLAHPRYGQSFIALNGETGEDLFPDQAFFVSTQDGYKCVACGNRPLSNRQACEGHKTSKSHQENVERYIEDTRISLGAPVGAF